jgi:hypothetical protein
MTIARQFDEYVNAHPRITLVSGFMGGALVTAGIALTAALALTTGGDPGATIAGTGTTLGPAMHAPSNGSAIGAPTGSAVTTTSALRERLFERSVQRSIRFGALPTEDQRQFEVAQGHLFAAALANDAAAASTNDRDRLTARSRQRPVRFGDGDPTTELAAFSAAEERLLGWLGTPPHLRALN